MKKKLTKIFLLFFTIATYRICLAQTNVIHISPLDLPSYDTVWFCQNDEIHIHAVDGCSNPWFICDYEQCAWGSNEVIVTSETPGNYHYGDDCMNSLQSCCILFSPGIPPSEPWTQNTMLKCPGTHHLYAQTNPQPDYTYLWSTGATTPYIDIDNLSTYGVTVTDACGNSISDEITINGIYPEHEPYLPEITYLCIDGTVTLDAGPGFSQYTWSNGANTQTITVNQPGEYWVQTINEYGCDGLASTHVQYMVPQSIDESIPLISIDTINMSNQIMVAWSVTNSYIQEVGIYREGLTNQWQQVGTANYQTGYFIDEVDGSERSYRYKLSAIDICGNQSELGRSYQSMNAAYLGPGVEYWWIQWTPYKISDINAADYYELYSVDNLQDFNISQVNAPIEYENTLGFYYVNLPHGIQDSILFVKAYIKSQYGGGSVMSNFVQNYELLDVKEINDAAFSIYPNPNNGTFTVQGTGNLTITNILGQTIFQQEIDRNAHIELPAGIYIAKLSPPDKGAPRSIAGWGFAPTIKKIIVQ